MPIVYSSFSYWLVMRTQGTLCSKMGRDLLHVGLHHTTQRLLGGFFVVVTGRQGGHVELKRHLEPRHRARERRTEPPGHPLAWKFSLDLDLELDT